jgi:invasin B
MSDTAAISSTARASTAWIPAFAQASASQGEARAGAGTATHASTAASAFASIPATPEVLLDAMQQGAQRLAAQWSAAEGVAPATAFPADPAGSTRPVLAEPPGYRDRVSAREAGDPGARLLQAMLELKALVNESSLDTIRSRLAALTARHQALRAQSDLAGEAFNTALTAAEEASRQALQAHAQMQAQAQAGGLAGAGRPELAAFEAAVDRALAAERALQAAEQAMKETVAFRLPTLEVSRLQTNASRLTEIMLTLQDLLSKANTEGFRARSEFLGEMARVRREAAMKEAVEVERQLRKQEQLSRVFGWLGRAFGWLLTALSFAAALFTGGASLIVAGVMLGLMVTDQIVSATTGVSPVGEAFQSVLSPIVEKLAEALESMMIGLGVDKETAKMIGMVLAAIVAIVVVIAVTVVGVKVAGRLLGPLLSKLAGGFASAAGRAVPSAVVRAAQQGGAALGKIGAQIRTRVAGDPVNAQMQGARLAQLANAGQFGVGAMTAGGQVAVAQLQLKASKAAAEFVILDHSLQVIQEMIDELLVTYAEGLRTLRGLMSMSASTFEEEAQVGRFILSGIHRPM